jgi:hypothetical protein
MVATSRSLRPRGRPAPGLGFEVDRSEHVVFAYRKREHRRPLLFPGLGCGMVDFEDSQRTENIGAPPRT